MGEEISQLSVFSLIKKYKDEILIHKKYVSDEITKEEAILKFKSVHTRKNDQALFDAINDLD